MHCDSRREHTALNELQAQCATFLFQYKWGFFNIIQRSHFWRMIHLCLNLGLDAPSLELEGQVVYPLHHAVKRIAVIHWSRLQVLMCCHTGQRGFLVFLQWVHPGMPESGVYLNRDQAILCFCYWLCTGAGSLLQPTTGVESRNLRVFSLQNEETNQPQTPWKSTNLKWNYTGDEN